MKSTSAFDTGAVRPRPRNEQTLDDRLLRMLSFFDALELEDPDRRDACDRQRQSIVDALGELRRLRAEAAPTRSARPQIRFDARLAGFPRQHARR